MKLQFTRKGPFFLEVSSPRSPASKKYRALDVVKKLKKRKHDDQPTIQFDKVTVETNNESDGYDTRLEDSFHVSSRKDTHVKMNFEETWIPDVTINISDMGTTINSGK